MMDKNCKSIIRPIPSNCRDCDSLGGNSPGQYYCKVNGKKWLSLEKLLLALRDVRRDSAFSFIGYNIAFSRHLYRQDFVEDVNDWPILTEKGKNQLDALEHPYIHESTD